MGLSWSDRNYGRLKDISARGTSSYKGVNQ